MAVEKPKTAPRTAYVLLVGGEFHGLYGSKEAMYIDAADVLYGHVEPIKRDWNEETPYRGGSVIVHKAELLSAAWARHYNWIDQLPPDVGAEHFDE